MTHAVFQNIITNVWHHIPGFRQPPLGFVAHARFTAMEHALKEGIA